MQLGVVRETAAYERRVALVPETVKRLVARKHRIVVETGAGIAAGVSDADYVSAGAEVLRDAASVFAQADVLLRIQPPSDIEVALMRPDQTIISFVFALTRPDLVDKLAARGVNLLSVDAVPRTTLAQMMDVLSSQATLAGYRAVLLAAEALPKLMPMLMTAAGTIAPAKVLVVGAGVAGLQAIATARRLGATVEAFDVRRVAKEQVESLGARFVEVDGDEDAQTAGGYAREVSEAYKSRQAEVLAAHVAKADAVITTALIPGRPAPRIVTAAMVEGMHAGSVLVDLAAEQGGNCELTRPGERIRTPNGVTVIGEVNLPSQMAVHASQMWSRNMEKLLLHLLGKDSAQLQLDTDDEITRGVVTLRAGRVVDPRLAKGNTP